MGGFGLLRFGEVRALLLALAALGLVLIGAGWLIGPPTALLVLSSVILLSLIFAAFTAQRYRNIRRLSEYLRRLSAGRGAALDIRDNEEGELSILKSEIYKVTQMLSEYNEQLQHDKLLLAEQMADISHQLKTPLTSLLVMVDLLQDEQLPLARRREFTSHLRAQLERMEWLVSALLRMSQLDTGVVQMKRAPVLAQTLLDRALQPLLIRLEAKEIDCVQIGSEEVVCCDLPWTTEALTNILKNSIEHTPHGGRIEIAVSNNPLYSEMTIADNGSGIERADLPHIFTRFYRGKNASPDSIGIGLAMSRSIMRSQQGDITVESRAGEGSTFYLRFYKSAV
jgi:signal transduction histidine kinase